MKHLTLRVEATEATSGELSLPFDVREKSRVRAVSTTGEVLGIHVERGTSIKGGDHLSTVEGEIYVVRAAPEEVSLVTSEDVLSLTRAAYHLGNRHVRLQVGSGWLSYQPDHVLDAMVRGLGLTVERVLLPFEPEAGAYQRRGASADEDGHDHGHHHHGHGHGHHHHGHGHGHGHHHHDEAHAHGDAHEHP